MSDTIEHIKGALVMAAQALPLEKRLRFWVAMQRGVKLGCAARYAEIEDRQVAGELLLLLLQAQQVIRAEVDSREILEEDADLKRLVVESLAEAGRK